MKKIGAFLVLGIFLGLHAEPAQDRAHLDIQKKELIKTAKTPKDFVRDNSKVFALASLGFIGAGASIVGLCFWLRSKKSQENTSQLPPEVSEEDVFSDEGCGSGIINMGAQGADAVIQKNYAQMKRKKAAPKTSKDISAVPIDQQSQQLPVPAKKKKLDYSKFHEFLVNTEIEFDADLIQKNDIKLEYLDGRTTLCYYPTMTREQENALLRIYERWAAINKEHNGSISVRYHNGTEFTLKQLLYGVPDEERRRTP